MISGIVKPASANLSMIDVTLSVPLFSKKKKQMNVKIVPEGEGTVWSGAGATGGGRP